MDNAELAKQIIQFTHVKVTPPGDISPGDPVIVEVIPGMSPMVPPIVTGELTGKGTGTLTLPAPIGTQTIPIDIVLNATKLVLEAANVKFTVKYRITDDQGAEYANYKRESLVPEIQGETSESDPLAVKLTLLPPLVSAEDGVTVTTFKLHVTIKVDVIGTPKTAEKSFDLPLVGIPVPTLLILRGDINDNASDHGKFDNAPSSGIVVMARNTTSLDSAQAALNALNALSDTLGKVKDIPGGMIFDLLLGSLGAAIADLAGYVPVTHLYLEEISDFGDINDGDWEASGFDDEARHLILIGKKGTQVSFYSGDEFNDQAGGENFWSTLEITEDLAMGFGMLTIPPIDTSVTPPKMKASPDLDETKWQHGDPDDDDNMFDIESCNFGPSRYNP